MRRLENKHPLAIRWLHWVNFPALFLMIWSGMLIYWANAVYGIRIFGHELFHFFPQGFFEGLGIPFRLSEGMALHFFFMWFFIANGVLYVLYTIISGEWRALLPVRGSLKRALRVTLYDLRLSKYHPPQGKYNDAQRIAYTGIILMGAGSLLTGLAIYKPAQFGWLTWAAGGYEWARWEHFWLTVGYVLFFITHVAQVMRAGWNNFRSMITGYEVVKTGTTPEERATPVHTTTAEEGARA